jgi:hypothetical protein
MFSGLELMTLTFSLPRVIPVLNCVVGYKLSMFFVEEGLQTQNINKFLLFLLIGYF